MVKWNKSCEEDWTNGKVEVKYASRFFLSTYPHMSDGNAGRELILLLKFKLLGYLGVGSFSFPFRISQNATCEVCCRVKSGVCSSCGLGAKVHLGVVAHLLL